MEITPLWWKKERLYGGDNAFMVEERTPLWWKRERLCGGKANTFVVETRTPLWWKSERLCGGNENAFVVEKRTPLWWKRERLYGGKEVFVERTHLESSPGVKKGSPGSVKANDLRVSMGTPSDTQGDFSTARPQRPNRALEEGSANRHSGEGGLHPKNRTGDLNVVNRRGGESGKHPKEKDWRLNSVAEVQQQKSSDVLGQDAPFAKFGLDAAHMPGMNKKM